MCHQIGVRPYLVDEPAMADLDELGRICRATRMYIGRDVSRADPAVENEMVAWLGREPIREVGIIEALPARTGHGENFNRRIELSANRLQIFPNLVARCRPQSDDRLGTRATQKFQDLRRL